MTAAALTPAELVEEFARLAARVTHLEAALTATATGPAAPVEIEPHFMTLDGFMEFFAEIVETRTSNTRRWCPEWAKHPGVVLRLTALWHAYESHRREPGASFSTWMIEHLDPHFAALTSPDGPFTGCSDTRHGTPRRLPIAR